MKINFLILLLVSIFYSNLAIADTYVKGYTRRDGTYVQGYHRSSPNNTRLDNYSTKGNYNPYTGKSGTVSPYNPYGSAYNNNYQRSLYSNKFRY